MERNNFIAYKGKIKTTNLNGIPFKIPFNINILNLETLVIKSFKNLDMQENLKDKKILLSNKIEPNIKALCVHGKFRSIEKIFIKNVIRLIVKYALFLTLLNFY